jgi:hypothetical protein
MGGKTNRMTVIFNYNLHLERNLGRRLQKEIAKGERKGSRKGRIVRNKEFQSLYCKSLYNMQTRFMLCL